MTLPGLLRVEETIDQWWGVAEGGQRDPQPAKQSRVGAGCAGQGLGVRRQRACVSYSGLDSIHCEVRNLGHLHTHSVCSFQ